MAHIFGSILMAIMFASMHFDSTMAQTSHIVGDALGWTIPSGGAAAYTTWASQQTFVVGDTLVFNFTNGLHDVAEVSAAAYGPCTSTNPISLATTGPATLSLTTVGTHYYICTFTSHCQIGQKLTINVSTSTTTTAPPTTTPPAVSPPPTTTPTPPSAIPTPPVEPCPPTSSPTSSPLSPPIANSPLSPPPFTTGNSPLSSPNSAAMSFTLMAVGLAVLNY